MWWKLYLLQYKRLVDRKLLMFSVLGLYVLYFVLLFDADSIISRMDLFTSSSFDPGDYLKYPLSIGTAVWIASFFVPLWMLVLILHLGGQDKKFLLNKKECVGKLSFAYTIPFDWTLTALLGGLLMWAHWGRGDVPSSWLFLLALWLQIVAYVSMVVLIVSIFKSAMASVLAFFGYFVLEAIVRKLLFSMNITLGFYLPAKVITSLVVPPAAIYADVAKFQDFVTMHSVPFWINAGLAVVYSILFLVISYFLNFKTHRK